MLKKKKLISFAFCTLTKPWLRNQMESLHRKVVFCHYIRSEKQKACNECAGDHLLVVGCRPVQDRSSALDVSLSE